MTKIFTRTFRVRWSEVDASGQVSPASYLRYLVETAYDWAIAGGLGEADGSNPLGIFWMIRETKFYFLQPLAYNEIFDFTIWMVSWQRVRGVRAFELVRKSDGVVIAQGTQQIVSLDADMRPMNLPEHLLENYRLESPRQFPTQRFPTLSVPASARTTQHHVEWTDLDQMQHVNNAIYLDYVEEAAARDFASRGWSPATLKAHNLTVAPRRMHIQYSSPALWGETLQQTTWPLSLHETGGSRCVRITRAEDGSSVADCILDWAMLDRQTGVAQSIPVDLAASLRQDLPLE